MALIDSTWTWRQLTPATPPSARAGMDMVWDGDRVLMFGGVNVTPSDETWELVGDEWNQLSPAAAPSARSDHRMMWDGTRVVLMGGALDNVINYSQETWKYETANWTQIVTANFPTDYNLTVNPGGIPIYASQLSWDGSRGLILWPHLQVGMDSLVSGTYTWEFAAGDWTRLTPAQEFSTSLIPRLSMASCWAGDRLVASGGKSTADATVNSTEEYDSTWAQTVANAPADATHFLHRKEHRMVFKDDEVFLFGGGTATTGDFGEPCSDEAWTYDLDTQTWGQVFPTDGPPPGRRQFAMVWDGNRVILFGGLDDDVDPLGDTWVLEPPPPAIQASIRHTFGLGE